jgi:hypothetical protein
VYETEGQLPPPPAIYKPSKFGQMLEKIKEILEIYSTFEKFRLFHYIPAYKLYKFGQTFIYKFGQSLTLFT